MSTHPRSVATVAAGADAVISAVSAQGVSYTLADVAPALVEGLRGAGVRRLVVVGGAGSLDIRARQAANGHPRLSGGVEA